MSKNSTTGSSAVSQYAQGPPRERKHNPLLKGFLYPVPQFTGEAKTVCISVVNRIIRAVGIKIKALRICKAVAFHPRRVNLGEFPVAES